MSLSEKIFYWLPRTLSVGFVLFISLFALDVFSEYTGWGIILPLFMHLIPSFVLLGAVAVAWKYDWVGVLMFLGFAALYMGDVGFGRPWSWYAGIVAPSSIVGILFLISWIQKRKQKQAVLNRESEPGTSR